MDRYWQYATTYIKCTLDVTRLFFDELEWFDMLDFKMDTKSGGIATLQIQISVTKS